MIIQVPMRETDQLKLRERKGEYYIGSNLKSQYRYIQRYLVEQIRESIGLGKLSLLTLEGKIPLQKHPRIPGAHNAKIQLKENKL